MRRSFYRGSLWGAAVVLPVSLAWFVLDPKGDARQHAIDRSIRGINWFRDKARF